MDADSPVHPYLWAQEFLLTLLFIISLYGAMKLVEKQLSIYECQAHKKKTSLGLSDLLKPETCEYACNEEECSRIQRTVGKIGYF